MDSKPAPAKSSSRADTPAASSAADKAASGSARSANTADTATSETKSQQASLDPAAGEAAPGDDGKSSETGLSEALLAALAAAMGNAEGETVPKELKDVEEALDQLAEALGIDLSSLVQQLTKLAEAAGGAGAEGGDGELVAKLTEFLAKTLNTPLETLDPEIQAGLTKLVEAAKKLAQPLPSEPELAEPALKLSEPVLTGKTAAAGAAPASPTSSAADTAQKAPGARPAPEMALREVKPAENTPDRPAQPATANVATPTAEAPTAQMTLQPMQADSATLPTESSAAAPRILQTGYQTSQQQLNLPQIAFEMARQVEGGNTRFQIRLDPPELGRIDVKLDIDSNGQVHARLSVEKAETLDLMQRDQRALQQALQQAGLDANKTNLEFSLKQNPFAGDQNERSDRQNDGSGEPGEAGADDSDVPQAVTLYRGALQASGLNIIA